MSYTLGLCVFACHHCHVDIIINPHVARHVLLTQMAHGWG